MNVPTIWAIQSSRGLNIISPTTTGTSNRSKLSLSCLKWTWITADVATAKTAARTSQENGAGDSGGASGRAKPNSNCTAQRPAMMASTPGGGSAARNDDRVT